MSLIKRIFSASVCLLCLFQLPFCKKGHSQYKEIELRNPEFKNKLEQTLSFSVPLISVNELSERHESIYLVDTRSKEEYQVSHIPGAHYGGYKDFNLTQYEALPKDTMLVFYCSIGYRSEKISEKMKKAGFTNVYNLYGSIFEWVNEGNSVVGMDGNKSEEVHTYNKRWGQWVDETKIKKVY